GRSVPELFESLGEPGFRALEAEHTIGALLRERPAVLGLGGGAGETAGGGEAIGEHALPVLLDVAPETAWKRVRGGDRPLARDEQRFRALHAERQPLYRGGAAAGARSGEG